MVSDYRRFCFVYATLRYLCSGYVISNIIMHAVLSNKISYKRCINIYGIASCDNNYILAAIIAIS